MDNSSEKFVKPTEQDYELVSEASDHFVAKNYGACIQSLQQLEESLGAHPKILHNKSVAAFYKNNCIDYKKLLSVLDQDIHDVEHNVEAEKTRNTVVLYYNKATILFHLRKYHAAINILHPMLNKLEDLDEPLASMASLLMLQLLISTHQYKKADKLLDLLQNNFGLNSEISTHDDAGGSDSPHNNENFQKVYKNLSTIVQIMNHKSIIIPDVEDVTGSVLKAHQYYLGKDFQMAAKQLSKKFSTDSRVDATNYAEDQDTCLANNMGIIHLRVRHYALALEFFQHSLTFDNKTTDKGRENSLFEISATRKPEILYNMGVSMLHLQRPKEAFECFLVPLKIYHNNPRLWLRVAEACIMLREQEQKQTEKKHIVSSVVGSGLHRKYILEPTPKTKIPIDGQSFAIPYPNYEFAALCLRNAISLTERYKKRFATTGSEENDNVEDKNYCNPSNPITKESFNRLVAAIYAAYCYVCIRLGEYLTALEYGKLLLLVENLSETNIMLAHLYCAESLVMLNRVREAQTYLDLKFISSLNAHDFETKEWQINSSEAAQSVLRYNLVLTLVLQGELEDAKKLLTSCAHPVVFTKFKLLKMYIELVSGNIENCKIMVRIDTPQFR